MLIGIPSCVGPRLLFNLCAMGHGDEIAIVDGNYPAETQASGPGGAVRADGVGVVEMLEAILQLIPLDEAVEQAIFHATVGGDGQSLAPVHLDMRAACARRYPGRAAAGLPGAEFYARVGGAHTIVATGERRLYGNVILRKGVIRPAS